MTAVCDQLMYIASDDVKEPVRLSYNTELTYSPRPSKREPSGLTRADRPGRCSQRTGDAGEQANRSRSLTERQVSACSQGLSLKVEIIGVRHHSH